MSGPGHTANPGRKLVLAQSLESAPQGAMVYVDNSGRVRSPARYRAAWAVTLGALGSMVGAGAALWMLTFGVVPGLAVGALMTGHLTWMMRRRYRIRRGRELIVAERPDEAIALLEKVAGGFLVPNTIRALARQNLAAAHAQKGDLEAALEHERAAIGLFRRSLVPPKLHRELAEYSEIALLAQLGRAREAQSLLQQKPTPPAEADYLRINHWAAELQVCFALGEHSLTDDDLHVRARAALQITSASALLALLAWAHQARGDDEQAWHLLRESYDREWPPGLTKTMPRLVAWMEANRAAAGVPSADDNGEDI